MNLSFVIATAIDPALHLLPSRFDSPQARVMLLAIGLQESRFLSRLQEDGGPARGFWQFESGGGVKGVMTHPAVCNLAEVICQKRSVPFLRSEVYTALANDDVLAAAFARLLLWTDPRPLPSREDANGGWALYQRVWRPGKPHPETWPTLYRMAVAQVHSEPAEGATS